MIRLCKICSWVVIVGVVIVAVGLTTLSAQKNDVPISEETKPSDNMNKDDTATNVELQPKDPVSRPPVVNIDSSTAVDIQRGFNELRSEYLDDRADYIDMWLAVIAIVLTFFGLVVVVLGYFGLQEFKKLKAEAESDAEEIKNHLSKVLESRAELERVRREAESAGVKTESDEAMQRTRKMLSAEVFAALSGDQEFEKVLRDFEQIPNLSFVDKAMIEAYKLQKDGKITEATQKWCSIANIVGEADKNLAAHSWFSAGYLYEVEDKKEEALSAYNKAINLKPDYAEAYAARGTMKSVLDRRESAVDDYNEAIRLKPDYAEAYNNRGFEMTRLGQYESAVDDCNEAIRLKPDFAYAYDSRGTAKQSLGQYESAVDDYNEAIHLKPDYAEAYYNRGNVHLDLENIESAKSDFQNALELAKEQGEKDLIDGIEKKLQELNEME